MRFSKKSKVVFLVLIVILAITSKVAADGHILVFHRFADDRYPSTNISKKELIKVFEYLEENNYQVISLEKMVGYIQNNRQIPDKTIALTIDDGYKSFYNYGLDIFKDYNYPFTIFINTKAINRGYSDFLTWKQVKEISRYGTIASHGYDHPHLTKLDESEIISDIEKSKVDIKENLGEEPAFFSYPYGEYDQRVQNIVRKLGFEAIFNQNLGAVARESDIYSINRIAISNASELKTKLIYDYLPAKWAVKEDMVIGDKLVKVIVEVAPEIDKAQLYISGYGWRRVELEDGLLEEKLNLELKYSRNRIFLKTYDNRLSGKVIVK